MSDQLVECPPPLPYRRYIIRRFQYGPGCTIEQAGVTITPYVSSVEAAKRIIDVLVDGYESGA